MDFGLLRPSGAAPQTNIIQRPNIQQQQVAGLLDTLRQNEAMALQRQQLQMQQEEAKQVAAYRAQQIANAVQAQQMQQAQLAALPQELAAKQSAQDALIEQRRAQADLYRAKTEAAKTGTESLSAAQKDDRRILLLQNKIKNGVATDEDRAELDLIGQRREAARMTQNPLDVSLAKVDATNAAAAYDTRNKMVSFRDFNQRARDQLEKTPAWALGPVASALKIDQLNPEAQILKGYAAASTLLAKDILGLKGGTQGFTEGERKFVEQVAGGTFQNKASLRELMDGMSALSKKVEYREWKKESDIRKNSASYSKWLEANPEPEEGKISETAKTAIKKASEETHSQEDLEYTAKKHGITVDEVKRRLGI